MNNRLRLPAQRGSREEKRKGLESQLKQPDINNGMKSMTLGLQEACKVGAESEWDELKHPQGHTICGLSIQPQDTMSHWALQPGALESQCSQQPRVGTAVSQPQLIEEQLNSKRLFYSGWRLFQNILPQGMGGSQANGYCPRWLILAFPPRFRNTLVHSFSTKPLANGFRYWRAVEVWSASWAVFLAMVCCLGSCVLLKYHLPPSLRESIGPISL